MPINPHFWESRPVLATGATGLMGGWLTKNLLQRGAEVVALVRDRSPKNLLAYDGVGDQLTFVDGSLEDYPLLRRTVGEYSIDTIFHLAAQPLVGVAKADP